MFLYCLILQKSRAALPRGQLQCWRSHCFPLSGAAQIAATPFADFWFQGRIQTPCWMLLCSLCEAFWIALVMFWGVYW